MITKIETSHNGKVRIVRVYVDGKWKCTISEEALLKRLKIG